MRVLSSLRRVLRPFCSSNKGLFQSVIQQQLQNTPGVQADRGEHEMSFTLDESIKGSVHGSQFMVVMFTCGVCDKRLSRKFTKHAYEEGVVIIRCDGCDNNHLMSDNLGWFEDDPVNIEQIMREQGKPHRVLKVDSPELQSLVQPYMRGGKEEGEEGKKEGEGEEGKKEE